MSALAALELVRLSLASWARAISIKVWDERSLKREGGRGHTAICSAPRELNKFSVSSFFRKACRDWEAMS